MGELRGNNAGGNYNISCEINLSKGRNPIEEKVQDKKQFACRYCP